MSVVTVMYAAAVFILAFVVIYARPTVHTHTQLKLLCCLSDRFMTPLRTALNKPVPTGVATDVGLNTAKEATLN